MLIILNIVVLIWNSTWCIQYNKTLLIRILSNLDCHLFVCVCYFLVKWIFFPEWEFSNAVLHLCLHTIIRYHIFWIVNRFACFMNCDLNILPHDCLLIEVSLCLLIQWLGWTVGEWFDFLQEQEIFSSQQHPDWLLGPTQSPFQWVLDSGLWHHVVWWKPASVLD